MTSRGRLVVVGTPIGNLSDLSPRGAEALVSADIVCCEDTRRTGLLMKHIGSTKKPYVVVNEHREFDQVGRVVSLVQAGKSVALVSDAGMPLVSDPGEILVAAVLEAGYDVDVVPGPTAVSTALALSGLSTRRFAFEGFLPRKGPERRRRLAGIGADERTVVCYESPHRVGATLSDLVVACGPNRRVAVIREMTKLHQEAWRGTMGHAADRFGSGPLRGEFVLVVGPFEADVKEWTDAELAAEVASLVSAGGSRRDAVAEVAGRTGAGKRRVYEIANRESG